MSFTGKETGRPPLGDVRRDVVIGAGVTRAESDAIKRAAAQRGISISEFVRRLVLPVAMDKESAA
jgi:uncharacterized protein (DUF1778 family)